MSKEKISLFWHRRDLRIDDNAGLSHALKGKYPVLPLFIFDKEILNDLEDQDDARVTFIHREVLNIQQELKNHKSGLLARYGTPLEIFKSILDEYDVQEVFTNHDYEPYATERDEAIAQLLIENNINFHTFKDHVIFEKDEVVKSDGSPYVVFTPYSKLWKTELSNEALQSFEIDQLIDNFYKSDFSELPSLGDMGFKESDITIPSKQVANDLLEHYGDNRNYPAKKGTSRLGVHLRFGTISLRKLAKKALETSDVFLNELIWREFYQSILWHFPKVINNNFKSQYDRVKWRNEKAEFETWCSGNTGYPIVDAGMRELNSTGYMHNRVRMIVASFLTKHLLIDWRWGEAYFARKLLDFELASNNGGWQWAAGTGTDAQPYFRIFNPESQTKKFDPELKYIKKWVPEFQELNYPKPIVDHKFARERCLDTFKEALGK